MKNLLLQLLLKTPVVSDRLVASLLNLSSVVTGRSIRVRVSDVSGFICSDGKITIRVPRRTRLGSVLPDFETSLRRYLEIYMVEQIAITKGDIVLDCGAHLGMVSVACQLKGAEVFAFEPDPVEAQVLHENLSPHGKVFELALWHSTGLMELESRNDSGDSSLLHTGKTAQKISVATMSLNEWSKGNIPEGKRIKLLKLEAEGAEPEVLYGATDIIEKIDYICADLGFERGPNAESTLAPVLSFLTQNGFTVIGPSKRALKGRRLIILFENNRFLS